jgi:hypothetical protein
LRQNAPSVGAGKRIFTTSELGRFPRETAIFAIRTLLLQTLGFKGHRAEVNFADDPVPLGDLFDLLEKLGGPAGWQLAQKLGGY